VRAVNFKLLWLRDIPTTPRGILVCESNLLVSFHKRIQKLFQVKSVAEFVLGMLFRIVVIKKGAFNFLEKPFVYLVSGRTGLEPVSLAGL